MVKAPTTWSTDIHQGSSVPHTAKSLNIGEYWEAALPKTAIAEEYGPLDAGRCWKCGMSTKMVA